MRITDRIEYFEEPIKSDKELFSKLKTNKDYIVVTRFVHSEEELWDAGLLTYDKDNDSWKWLDDYWKLYGSKYEYHGYVSIRDIEEHIYTHVQCVTESMENI